MITKLLGNKVGMGQVFTEDKLAVPITVINVSDWLVTQIKTTEKDSYKAIQVGKLKKRHRGKSFSQDWLSKKSNFFTDIKEIRLDDSADLKVFSLGLELNLADHLAIEKGDFVSVSGKSTGLGFQGVVKRWNFAGGPGGHGSTFHRAPGSVGFMRRQGEVIKGKKLPGHCGNKRITVKGLEVMHLDKESGNVFVKGAVPGKKNSLIYIRKQG